MTGTFEFNQDFNLNDFAFEGMEILRDMLKSTAFFSKYNYRDGVVSGYTSTGEKIAIGKVVEN